MPAPVPCSTSPVVKPPAAVLISPSHCSSLDSYSACGNSRHFPDSLIQLPSLITSPHVLLSPFDLMPDPTFLWDDVDGESFCHLVKSRYDHWRHNVFMWYRWYEMARLIQAYACCTLESVAFYAVMIMPSLLLQKPVGKVRAKELDRHLSLWFKGFTSSRGSCNSISSEVSSHS